VEILPVNCEPSVFKESTDSRAAPPLRPGVVQIQLPSASAAWSRCADQQKRAGKVFEQRYSLFFHILFFKLS
jgi:hypothetical protein